MDKGQRFTLPFKADCLKYPHISADTSLEAVPDRKERGMLADLREETADPRTLAAVYLPTGDTEPSPVSFHSF